MRVLTRAVVVNPEPIELVQDPLTLEHAVSDDLVEQGEHTTGIAIQLEPSIHMSDVVDRVVVTEDAVAAFVVAEEYVFAEPDAILGVDELLVDGLESPASLEHLREPDVAGGTATQLMALALDFTIRQRDGANRVGVCVHQLFFFLNARSAAA